jgi:hypothetical protein
MKKTLTAILVLALLGGAGAALWRSSFVSFKSAQPAGADASAAIAATLPEKITFNENIQPILSDNCYFCHGQDATARKADLRVDREEFVFLPRKSGSPVIVKGHPESSALIQRISSTDPNLVMPPPASHKAPLTPYQVALITRWVKEGAKYEEHWAFVAPKRPPAPEVKQAAWVRNPIDSFVLAKLESKGLAPEPEADRRSLIRRVTFDLTGLPPTPQEVSDFVADTSTNAYEKVVDRLLANPHYGEHEARYWLDAARYAETVGLHIDEPRQVYPYRDWVINAFNANKRFDQFVIEQVAGDLLPNPTLEQKVATGFTRCGISTSEGGSIEEEVLATYAKEHVETNATTFMGLTMGCCACHDHKFDPISQKEFYEFTAFFRNTTQAALGDREAPSVPPYIRVPAMADRPRWFALPGEQAAVQKSIDDYTAAFRKQTQPRMTAFLHDLAAKPLQTVSADRLELRLPLNEGAGNQITSSAQFSYKLSGAPKWDIDGLLGPAAQIGGPVTAELDEDIGDFDAKEPCSFGCWVRVPGPVSGALFGRMDSPKSNYRGWDIFLQDGRPDAQFIDAVPARSLFVESRQGLARDVWHHLFVTYTGNGRPGDVKIYIDGVPQEFSVPANGLGAGSIRTKVPFTIGRRAFADGVPGGVAIQDLRIYRRVLAPSEIRVLMAGETMAAALKTPPEKMSPIQQQFALDYYLKNVDPKSVALYAKADALKAESDAIANRSPATMVMDDKPTPAFAYILKRGQYDQKGDKVFPDTPKVLPPMRKEMPKNRLGLAEWMVAPENPLLARVTVNRFWQQFFGIGIVRTAEDFGVMGERPVNQPLLDWMAVEFRESGWDVKHMLKLVVMSNAYRQSDHVSPEKLQADPENRLISRGPRFRLDAEEIRDQALAASGLLNPAIGGPSVKPYQPPGLWEVVSMTGESYRKDSGEALYRRSMYSYLKRLAPQPQLTIFDAPTREVCTVRRERTDTPLQALAMENDPQYMEAARHLAVNAIVAASSPAQRLDYMSERLLARPLQDKEQAVLMKSLAEFDDTYSKAPDAAAKVIRIGDSPADTKIPAPEQAAWTMVASEFLNLDETLNK